MLCVCVRCVLYVYVVCVCGALRVCRVLRLCVLCVVLCVCVRYLPERKLAGSGPPGATRDGSSLALRRKSAVGLCIDAAAVAAAGQLDAVAAAVQLDAGCWMLWRRRRRRRRRRLVQY